MKKIIVFLLISFIFFNSFQHILVNNNDCNNVLNNEKFTKASNQIKIVHNVENAVTLSEDITNDISFPIYISYHKKYNSVSMSIKSSDNIKLLTNENMNIIGTENESENLIYYDTIQFSLNSLISTNSYNISDIGEIVINCIATDETGMIVSSNLTLNVLISSNTVLISEFGIDSIEKYYFNWLKENNTITKTEYNTYIKNYYGVDYVTTNNQTTFTNRDVCTNRLKTQLELANLEPISTLSVSSTTTTAAESSVYIKYSIVVSGDQLHISGNVYWKDVTGTEHPVKKCMIEIIDEEPLDEDFQARVYTNNNGYFSSIIDNQTGIFENGCDIFFRVYSQNTTVNIKDSIFSDQYYFQTQTDLNIKTSINNKIQGILNTDIAKSFSVMQAMIEGYNYAYNMDSSYSYFVSVIYPSTSSFGTSNIGSTIYITSEDYHDWDPILHEYGHYIASVLNIISTTGGAHSSDKDLYDMHNDKGKAIRLAWAEGWATYFSIAAQTYLNLSGIPQAGNYMYEDDIDAIVDIAFSYSIKTPKAIGETNERDISYMLIMIREPLKISSRH